MRKFRKIIGVLALLILCVTLSAVLSRMDFWEGEDTSESTPEFGELGIRAYFSDPYESEPSWWDFDENTEEFLSQSLTAAIGEKYNVVFDTDSMSRCTTYVDYQLSTKEDEETPLVKEGFYYGEAILFEGCGGPSDQKTTFRLSTNEMLLQVQKANGDYGSVEEWLAE